MATKLSLCFPQTNHPPFEVLPDQEIIVGRAPTCEVDLIRYLADRERIMTVSREHFKIFYRKDEGFIIVDISYNGTQVNEDFLTKGKPRILRDGDIIKLAKADDLIIKVEIDDDPDSTATVDEPAAALPALNREAVGLYFDKNAAQFVVDGEPIPHEHLTRLEVSLLTYLYNNLGKLCSFDEIAEHVWNDPGWAPGNNTISRAIGNLRKKLDQISPGAEEYVQNIRGQGYKVIAEK